jgi:hypothetical protein
MAASNQGDNLFIVHTHVAKGGANGRPAEAVRRWRSGLPG